MKVSLFMMISFVALFSVAVIARGKSDAKEPRSIGYVHALSVADQFMTAWQYRNQVAGLALVSDSLKEKESEDDLRMYISGLSNPHHEAFEICSGKRLPDGSISFEVMMYETYTGYPNVYPAGPSQIVLSKNGRGKWLVVKLP